MNNNRNNNNNNDGNGWPWWQYGAAIAGGAAGVAAMIGGAYYIAKNKSESQDTSPRRSEPQQETSQTSRQSALSNFGDFLQNLIAPTKIEDSVSKASIPLYPHVSNLNSLLADIYVRHVALKEEDFKLHYRVFCEVFSKIHNTMKDVDKYYQRYSSNVQFAGSHYDRLRINKPDEFDVDIVIGLPVNFYIDPNNPSESDIVIEQYYPGFVQLRAGVQYQNILIRDGPECLINRTAHEWLDDRKYILRSKFTSWFKSVGTRAMNQFPKEGNFPVCYVDGVPYRIRTSESGPAWTLIIEAPGFKLDVDLVPSLRFPETRWLNGRYRAIPLQCKRDYWLVVPKPNKAGNTLHDQNRSWRIALQDQEKQLLHNSFQLRQTIRLLKKLRDSQNMNKIASYHIKTIFFWEIIDLQCKNQSEFWKHNNMATLFKHMLQKFYDALDKREILFFWHRQQNMIENIEQSIINEYKDKLLKLMNILEEPSRYKEVAKFLLTNEEYNSYKGFLY